MILKNGPVNGTGESVYTRFWRIVFVLCASPALMAANQLAAAPASRSVEDVQVQPLVGSKIVLGTGAEFVEAWLVPSPAGNGIQRQILTFPGQRTPEPQATGPSPSELRSGVVIERAPPTADMDRNGLPDNPFTTLSVDGALWFGIEQEQVVGAVRWDGNSEHGGQSANIVLQDPNAPECILMVAAPRGLARAGEIAVLTVIMSPNSTDFFGVDVDTVVNELPGKLVPGGRFVEISVLVTADGGATFDEIDDSRLLRQPMTFIYQGLAPKRDATVRVYSYPTYANSAESTGVFFEPERGEWRDDKIRLLGVSDYAFEAELSSLSVFAPLLVEISDDAEDSQSSGDSLSALANALLSLYSDGYWSGTASGSEGPLTEGDEAGKPAAYPKDASIVWVDFDYGGVESGTESEPYNTLAEGVAEVDTAGTVRIKHGQSTETMTISKALTLEAHGGVARIGGELWILHAEFSADVLSGPAPLTVQFTDESDVMGARPIDDWAWDLGDGTQSTTQHPMHVYENPGFTPLLRTVSLTVSHTYSNSNETKVDYITVYPEEVTLTTSVKTTAGQFYGGTVEPDGGTYPGGTQINIEATPDHSRIVFDHWEDGLSGSDNPTALLMDTHKLVTAVFEDQRPDLQVDEITTAPPSTALAGDSATVAWNGLNASLYYGTELDWADALFLSRDPQLTGDDKELDRETNTAIGAEGTYMQSLSAGSLPDVSPGPYYLLLALDVDGEVDEADEDNVMAFSLTVADGVLGQ